MGLIRADKEFQEKINVWKASVNQTLNRPITSRELTRLFARTYIPPPLKGELALLRIIRKL